MKDIYRKQTRVGRHSQRAQAIVEFAIVLPILMMVLVGILEAGRMLYIYAAVNNASREAVRFGSALGFDDNGYHKYKDCAGIRERATRSAYFTPLTITITYDTGPGTGSIATCTASSGEDASVPVLSSGNRVLVSVTAHYRPLINLIPFPQRDFTSVSARTVLGFVEVGEATGGGGGGGGGGGATATSTSPATATSTSTLAPTATNTATATATFSGPFATPTPVTPSSTPATATSVATSTAPATATSPVTATATSASTSTNTPVSTSTPTATNTVVATATTACTAPSVTLNASADAWVDQKNPTTISGTGTTLSVSSQNGNKNTRTLVNFSLPALPAGCKINTATLSLYASSQTSGRTLQALQVSSSWTETGVNWNNQPTTTGTGATVITTTGSAYLQWTVTSLVQSMTSGTNYGFMIRDSSEGSNSSPAQVFVSREVGGTTQPQLVITYTQGP